MIEGIIIKGVGGFYDVLTDKKIISCRARGKFRKDGIIPLVGDRVKIDEKKQFIEEILPRKNELVRPAVANIDFLGIVISVKEPEPDFYLVDKLMVSAEINNIQPVLIINKIDLFIDESDLRTAEEIDAIKQIYEKTNYPVILLSCKKKIGLDGLNDILKRGITAFSGQSGVGKSSIIKLLCPEKEIETGSLSRKINRGRHTTRHVELLPLSIGGMVVDTPGFSMMSINIMEPDSLQFYYPEFNSYLDQCRFTGCIHYHEPGCAVKEAVREGKISKERYERYIKIYTELKEKRRDVW